MSAARRTGWLIAAAPLIFVVSWSTGNIFTKLGLPHAEPFTFLAIRFALATLLLAAIAMIFRAKWPATPREIGHILVAGALVYTVYLCAVFVAIAEGVATGTAALIAGLQPILTAAVVGRVLGETVSPRRWIGLGLGLAGVTLVVWRKLAIAEGSELGMALAVLAMVGLTAGAIYQKRFCSTMDLRTGTTIQLAAAAVSAAVLALAFETREVAWTGEFVLSLGWLIVVLTVGAYMLLFHLLAIGEASKVASLFYLTPPTTAVMGYFMFGETLGILALVGMAVAVAGFVMAAR
jgi:drug/metabolite transporter (DMT)-like permease